MTIFDDLRNALDKIRNGGNDAINKISNTTNESVNKIKNEFDNVKVSAINDINGKLNTVKTTFMNDGVFIKNQLLDTLTKGGEKVIASIFTCNG